VTPDEYQKLATVTEFTPDFVRLGQGPEHDRMIAQLLHAYLGLSSEVGELADALKKHIIYGKALDEINVFEELGDVEWYIALGLTAVKRSLEGCMKTNIAKLQARYGDKFTQAAALERDLDKERDILEDSHGR
jgi:NTP pyrophosphatase (non-canonical NTP hydrolase)